MIRRQQLTVTCRLTHIIFMLQLNTKHDNFSHIQETQDLLSLHTFCGKPNKTNVKFYALPVHSYINTTKTPETLARQHLRRLSSWKTTSFHRRQDACLLCQTNHPTRCTPSRVTRRFACFVTSTPKVILPLVHLEKTKYYQQHHVSH